MVSRLSTHHAFISLGANLPGDQGDPAITLKAALDALQVLSREALHISSLYRSDPWDCPPGSPSYVNAVAALLPLPGEDANSLLTKMQQIEKEFGRARTGLRNEARTLDLDLLAFADVLSTTPHLILPHPRAHERRFVLEPWAEIAGSSWELSGKTLAAWLDDCTDTPLQKLQ